MHILSEDALPTCIRPLRPTASPGAILQAAAARDSTRSTPSGFAGSGGATFAEAPAEQEPAPAHHLLCGLAVAGSPAHECLAYAAHLEQCETDGLPWLRLLPTLQDDVKELVKLAKKLKKNAVAVDVVNFGEDAENLEKLQARPINRGCAGLRCRTRSAERRSVANSDDKVASLCGCTACSSCRGRGQHWQLRFVAAGVRRGSQLFGQQAMLHSESLSIGLPCCSAR